MGVVSPVPTDEVLARLSPDERRWVEDFRDTLRRRYGERVRDLRLFGSKVRGDDHDESDVDILVLVEGCDLAVTLDIVDAATRISTWLSPSVFDFDRYHQPSSRASGFYQEMRHQSVRL